MSTEHAKQLPSTALLIVLAGETLPELRHAGHGDFGDWIAAGLGEPLRVVQLDARTAAHLPDPALFAGVVVSGSHAMVTDREAWSERLAVWLRSGVEAGTPVLGICYGHQLLAHAMGGRVGDRLEGVELGSQVIRCSDAAAGDALFNGLPASFPAQLVHRQSVLDLPEGATLLARSAGDPHQAYRIGTCAWGVQFHPEFPAIAMDAYIRHLCAAPGQSAQARGLLESVVETPVAAQILRRFAGLATGKEKM